ncbi:heme exporter protein CcmD [Moraxella sp.]|uniref:heme exporter protein CcmD n=1 Tax=Moraxella sp. TaxID=479 RepID=UPI0026DC4F08|nr:heme exporter protein CcmD [Moraxella sp.]MDO4894563.1 heme exporter protein CcmD [Moraxella sp.]
MTPYFQSIQAFLAMGGHGFYVWLCYAIVFVAVLALIMYARIERRQVLARLGRQHQSRLTNKQRKQQSS